MDIDKTFKTAKQIHELLTNSDLSVWEKEAAAQIALELIKAQISHDSKMATVKAFEQTIQRHS